MISAETTQRRNKNDDRLTRSDKLRLNGLRRRLLRWYEQHRRVLPWRSITTSIYEKICVEILLQRTRAETVSRAYPSFFERFRDWSDIAGAEISELEDYFRPIGLWQRRARSIKGLATYAAARDGLFPVSEDELANIPGVGQYVANAILLFQHGQPRPLLDVNMARVIERYVRPRRLADIRHDPWLQAAAHWLVRGAEPVRVSWAALDLASALCLPRIPRCTSCPLNASCNFAALKSRRGRS
jgi:A/G-specific adenine glycosylase